MRIIVETTFENGTTTTRRLGCLSRPFRRRPHAILLDQIGAVSEASRICPDRDRVRAIQGYRSRRLDRPFGRFRVKAPRIRRCACNGGSDVLPGGPLSSLARFIRTARPRNCDAFRLNSGHYIPSGTWQRLLHTFLPCAKRVNRSARNGLGKVAGGIDNIEQTASVVAAAGSPPVLGLVRIRPAAPRAGFARRPVRQRRRDGVGLGQDHHVVADDAVTFRPAMASRRGAAKSGRTSRTQSRNAPIRRSTFCAWFCAMSDSR